MIREGIRKGPFFIWGEGEGLFEERGEGAAGVYGVSESVGGVWGAVCGGIVCQGRIKCLLRVY